MLFCGAGWVALNAPRVADVAVAAYAASSGALVAAAVAVLAALLWTQRAPFSTGAIALSLVRPP